MIIKQNHGSAEIINNKAQYNFAQTACSYNVLCCVYMNCTVWYSNTYTY